jgi:hypothetical protein
VAGTHSDYYLIGGVDGIFKSYMHITSITSVQITRKASYNVFLRFYLSFVAMLALW